jgi:hypothetical protein
VVGGPAVTRWEGRRRMMYVLDKEVLGGGKVRRLVGYMRIPLHIIDHDC